MSDFATWFIVFALLASAACIVSVRLEERKIRERKRLDAGTPAWEHDALLPRSLEEWEHPESCTHCYPTDSNALESVTIKPNQAYGHSGEGLRVSTAPDHAAILRGMMPGTTQVFNGIRYTRSDETGTISQPGIRHVRPAKRKQFML